MVQKIDKNKIKEQLLYLYERNNSKLYDNFKLKINIFIKNRDNKTFDLLFYFYTKSLNDNRKKIKQIVLKAIEKVESKYITPYINELKKDIPVIFNVDQNDAAIFLKKMFLINPVWVYNFMKKRKGLLQKDLYNYFLKINESYKKLEFLKGEVENLIKDNLEISKVSYFNIDYFKEIKNYL